MLRICTVIVVLLLAPSLYAGVKSEPFEYKAGEKNFKGAFYYQTKATQKLPGIIFLHDYQGLDKISKQRAQELAKLGYAVLAADLYGDGKTYTDKETISRNVQSYVDGTPEILERLKALREAFIKHGNVDPKRFAVVGYGFGGSVAMTMGRYNLGGSGVISIAGMVYSPLLKSLHTDSSYIAMIGNKDRLNNASKIEIFKREMQSAGNEFEVITYDDATHAFANPRAKQLAKMLNMDIAYNKDADKKSWQDLQKYLTKFFSKSGKETMAQKAAE